MAANTATNGPTGGGTNTPPSGASYNSRASLYHPGMTSDDINRVLASDPEYLALMRDPAMFDRQTNKLTAAGKAQAQQLVGPLINELNVYTMQHSGDRTGAAYGLNDNGTVYTQREGDGRGPEFWGPIIVAAATGGIGAAYGVGGGGAAAAGGGAATTGATGGGTLASTTIGSGYIGGIEGGTGLATGVGTAGAGVGAGVGATDLGGDVLDSYQTVFGATDGLPSGVASGTDAAAALGGGGTSISQIMSQLGTDVSTAQKIAALLGAGGKGIGAAETAAGNNRLNQESLALDANRENITGQSAFEQELLARTKEEDSQRQDALKNVYRENVAENPSVSPFNPVGAPKFSDQYKGTLAALAGQGADKLKSPAQYDTNNMTPLKPYTPINVTDVPGSTGTSPSTLATIGNWVGPGLTIAQLIAQYSKK